MTKVELILGDEPVTPESLERERAVARATLLQAQQICDAALDESRGIRRIDCLLGFVAGVVVSMAVYAIAQIY